MDCSGVTRGTTGVTVRHGLPNAQAPGTLWSKGPKCLHFKGVTGTATDVMGQ